MKHSLILKATCLEQNKQPTHQYLGTNRENVLIMFFTVLYNKIKGKFWKNCSRIILNDFLDI